MPTRRRESFNQKNLATASQRQRLAAQEANVPSHAELNDREPSTPGTSFKAAKIVPLDNDGICIATRGGSDNIDGDAESVRETSSLTSTFRRHLKRVFSWDDESSAYFSKAAARLADKKAHQMRLVKSSAIEHCAKRQKKKMSIISFTLYMCFIMVYFVAALDQMRVTDTFTLQSALKSYIESKSGSGLSFNSISSLESAWTWMQTTLLDLLYPEQVWYNGDPLAAEDKGFLLEFNKLIGGFRLRQRRIHADGPECVASKRFQELYPHCWPTSLKGSEETAPYGPFYEPTKYSWMPDPEGGGYYISIPSTSDARTLAQNILGELKADLWMDKSTRDISFNFLVYNGNYRLFSIVSAYIELMSTGLVKQKVTFQTFKLEMYATHQDSFRLCLEIVVLIFVTINLLNEVKEMVWDGRKQFTFVQRLRRYFTSFWNWINMSLLVVMSVVIIQYVHLISSPEYKELDFNAEMLTQDQYVTAMDYGLAWRRYQELHATCVLLFLFTIFKYISESSEYGVLVRTITRSAPNLLKFLAVFAVIAVAFTTMGLLLFGHTVKEWSSVWEATQEYTVMLAENSGYDLIKGTSPVAYLYYLVFVFIVFMILVNIILAVLMDSYAALQIELEQDKEDRVLSERVDYSVLGELLMQIVKSPAINWMFRHHFKNWRTFLTTGEIMEMIGDPELAARTQMEFPAPTVANPHPAPIEFWVVEDLIAVHGRDKALFIMNQLGEVWLKLVEVEQNSDISQKKAGASTGGSCSGESAFKDEDNQQKVVLLPAADGQRDETLQALVGQVAALTSHIATLGQQLEAVKEAHNTLIAQQAKAVAGEATTS